MKTKLSQSWAVGAVAAILCLSGGSSWSIANAQDQPPTPSPAGIAAPDDSTALPPGVYPSSPLAQVIKLTQSGVSEGVIMAYVTNSGSAFNLDPDKIIYLKDIGAPDELVTAMIQRDQVLQEQMAASANQPPPQPAPSTETVATGPVPVETPVEQPAPVTVNYFYDSLAPYGAWVDVEGYGRCWRPTVMVVNAGWQPYCDHGHWVYTDAGWYWISDYSWGWAPFHYGRWFHHASFGWCWAPDTVWGPSWVTWRYSDDYCGWAPLPPRAVFREGVGFVYNGAGVSIGFDFGLDAGAFTFVHTRDFCDSHPWRHRVESREARQIFNRTTVINSFDVDRSRRSFINRGIDPGRITTATRTEIRPIAIRETTGHVERGERLERDGRTLMVNRPHFSDNPSPSNPGAWPHATPPSPAMGSPYQQSHNGDKNNNLEPQRGSQPMPQAQTQVQRQIPPVTTSGSPVRNGMTTRTGLSPRYAPVAPVQPQAPNDKSTDNRRYPSPKMQQTEQQSPGANLGNVGVGALITTREHTPITTQEHTPITTREHTPITTREHTPITTQEHTPITTQEHTPITTQEHTPITTREHTPITTQEHTPITTQEHTPITTQEHTPITTRVPANSPEANHFTPPSQPSAPAQPPQHNYVSPRNEQLQNESRPNNNSQNSQPAAAGNQSRGSSEPSSPPAQSQRSGRDRNQK